MLQSQTQHSGEGRGKGSASNNEGEGGVSQPQRSAGARRLVVARRSERRTTCKRREPTARPKRTNSPVSRMIPSASLASRRAGAARE